MTRLRSPLAALPFPRRTTPAARVGTERWMVSYADLVTLLFAFFVVLYAVSRVDPQALDRFTRSMQRAFQAGVQRGAGAPAAADASAAVRERLAAAGLGAVIPTREDERGIALTLPADAFFHAGTATLRLETVALLEEVGRFLATLEGMIVVEGHGDDQPTGSTLYATAWELSAARAARVVRHLAETCALDAARLSAVGLGASRPARTGIDAADEAANRRLEIVVVR
jgi:chemotaxis protein MotB